MPSSGKRNAEEAFGKDAVATSSDIPPKKSRNRKVRKERKERKERNRAQHENPESRSKTKKKPRSERNKFHVKLAPSTTEGLSNEQQKQLQKKESILAVKERQKDKKAASYKQQSSNQWSVARPFGGSFIDHDPILTDDEEYLILATTQDIQVYSTKTSLLVRTLHATRKSEITTYAQTTTQDQYIIVGLKDGSLLKFDWTTGQKVWAASFTGRISSIASTSSNTDSDALLMLVLSQDGSFNLTSVSMDKHGKILSRKQMMSQQNLLQRIVSSAETGVAVICSRDRIFIAQLGDSNDDNEAPLHWKEISIAGRIASFDAEIKRSSQQDEQPLVNIAVGLKSGEIQLYDDVLQGMNLSQEINLRPRRLHWHRTAPRTVKFSPDSNYLISGGDETVLIIWQFLTNQKQTLPHLTTAILNATVSRRGSAYALRLADNSVMVLSTSDLRPFADVSNLAIHPSSSTPFLPGLSVPAVLHPEHADRLLLAYSLQSLNPNTRLSEKSVNMLQTFDIASQLRLNRQALARNLATTVNISPSGEFLKEPDCTHLDITHDGKWLVTVDQWKPSESDLKEMYLSRGDQSSRNQMNECFLRFWSTNESAQTGSSNMWELNTRIDEPFATTEMVSERHILAISVNSTKVQVAVVDSGRHLKTYSPKARTRSGVPIKNADGQQLFTWTCDYDISLQEASPVVASTFASVAFSEDGSVIAASCGSKTNLKPLVHLIDSRSADIVSSLPELVTGSRCLLAFCRQHLVALSEKICAYDIVTMQQTFEISFDHKFDEMKSKMAVNTKSEIIAVSLSEKNEKSASRLFLLDGHTFAMQPVLEEKIPAQIYVLLPERDAGGFVIVDGQGRTIRISSPGSLGTMIIPEKQGLENKTPKNSLNEVFGKKQSQGTVAVAQKVDNAQTASLETVLTFESTARTPGARDLFNKVALLVSGARA